MSFQYYCQARSDSGVHFRLDDNTEMTYTSQSQCYSNHIPFNVSVFYHLLLYIYFKIP